MILEVGARFGRYVVERLVGEGGMGSVYAARDPTLGRRVALKVLRGSGGAERTVRERLLREARAGAALSHPNATTVYEVGEHEGHPYIAMEYLEGRTLRAALGAGDVAIETRLRWLLDVARVLAVAHAAGLVHRDIKPDNVMVTRDGVVKVLDFGITRAFAGAVDASAATVDSGDEAARLLPLTTDGVMLGTPLYMAPEQMLGNTVDGRTDQFAWGVTAYELACGRLPWRADTDPHGGARVVALILSERPAPPLEAAGVSPEVSAIVAKALEKDPARRFASTTMLVDALARATRVSFADARGSMNEDSPRRARSRATVRATLAVVAVAVAAVVAVVALIVAPGPPRANITIASEALPASSGADAARAHRGRRITDRAEQKASDPRAQLAYAAALQSLRDGSVSAAFVDLNRATKLDAGLAAAHLRLALAPYWRGSVTSVREHYAAASRSRASLDERDLMFLFAAEAVTRNPPGWVDYADRLGALLARFPDDAEALFDRGIALRLSGRPVDGQESLERALAVDPEFAGALWAMAVARYFSADEDGVMALLDRCLDVSPSASSCLGLRASVHRGRGSCAEYEATARQLAVAEPKAASAFWLLADALAARGASLESVREALARKTALEIESGAESPASAAAIDAVALGALTGDLVAVAAAAREMDRLAAEDTTEHAHGGPTMVLVSVLEEQGQALEAFRVAEAFERRTPAWTSDSTIVRAYLLFARHRAGQVGDADFARDRQRLVEEAVGRWGPQAATATLQTAFVQRAGEAADTAARIPGQSWDPFVEGFRGKVFLLAGRVDEALAPLRRAAAACAILPVDEGDSWVGYQAFGYVRARLWLGEALEAKGDRTGACTAYAAVLDRWKNPKPRSVTVEEARSRARALGCAR